MDISLKGASLPVSSENCDESHGAEMIPDRQEDVDSSKTETSADPNSEGDHSELHDMQAGPHCPQMCEGDTSDLGDSSGDIQVKERQTGGAEDEDIEGDADPVVQEENNSLLSTVSQLKVEKKTSCVSLNYNPEDSETSAVQGRFNQEGGISDAGRACSKKSTLTRKIIDTEVWMVCCESTKSTDDNHRGNLM